MCTCVCEWYCRRSRWVRGGAESRQVRDEGSGHAALSYCSSGHETQHSTTCQDNLCNLSWGNNKIKNKKSFDFTLFQNLIPTLLLWRKENHYWSSTFLWIKNMNDSTLILDTISHTPWVRSEWSVQFNHFYLNYTSVWAAEVTDMVSLSWQS